jgi:hypothetical protein
MHSAERSDGKRAPDVRCLGGRTACSHKPKPNHRPSDIMPLVGSSWRGGGITDPNVRMPSEHERARTWAQELAN